MIRISAIVPTYNRVRELRACLQGFAEQTAARGLYEVIVIDDGSAESMEPLAMEFAGAVNVVYRRIENSGQSVAKNLAIDAASSPLLLFYDDDLSPRPGIIARCLEFHDAYPDEAQALLLWFRPAPAIRDEPLIQWAFPRMYPFPRSPGGIGAFWGGTVSCKKSIFRFARFNPEFRALEDMEMELRLRRRIELQVHFERRTMGLYTHELTLPQFLRRTYSMSYYDYRLARKYPGAYGRQEPFEAEKYLVPAHERKGLAAAAMALLGKRPAPDSAAFRMLAALLTRLESHAAADGWITARDGGSAGLPGAEPPGTL